MKEIWKDIEGYEGQYKISNTGRVFSVKSGACKVLDKNNGGYLRVQLSHEGVLKRFFVHRLVAKAFVSGFFEGADVNHKDFNRQNNSADNLEWVTKSQNTKWSIDAKRIPGVFKDKAYKLVYSDGSCVVYKNIRACAKALGLCKSTLYNYISKHKGLIKRLNCCVVPCVSNDYPEMEYSQAWGNGGSSESC